MNNPATLLSFLPIVLPLIGAAAIRLAPRIRWPFHPTRSFYLVVLTLTALSLLATGGQPPLPAEPPALPWSVPLTLTWTALGRWSALLLLMTLSLAQLPLLEMPLAREQAVLLLLLLATALAVFAAGNLLVLSVAWGLGSMGLFALRIVQPAQTTERAAQWDVWGNLVSIILLIAGAALLASPQADPWQFGVITSPTALVLLMAAVALRLVTFPLVGGLQRHWQVYLLSLGTGIYLWLRVGASLAAATAPLGWVVAVAVVVLIGTGVLAGLYAGFGRTLAYVILHWLILAVTAPMLAPQTGYAVPALVGLLLTLSLALLRIRSALGSRGHVIGGLALAALAGAPLTPGWAAHWLFLRILWEGGQREMALWSTLSYLLITVPLWRQGLNLPQTRREDQHQVTPVWVSLVGAALLSLSLLLIGVYPGLPARLLAGVPLNLDLLTYRGLLAAGLLGNLALAAGTLIVPFLGGYALLDILRQVPPRALHRAYQFRRAVNLDWLYLILEERLGQSLQLLGRGLATLEEFFFLGWTLLWGMAFVFYLLRG